MSELFTQSDAWTGGFYELQIKLPDNSSHTIRETLSILWNHPFLEGCYRRSDVEPTDQEKVSPLDMDLEDHWYGVATHQNKKMSCCGSFYWDYQDLGCWLTLYFPMGALSQVYPVRAYPFYIRSEPSSEIWLKEINSFLVEIAHYIYQTIPFKVGVIGFEVDPFDITKLVKGGIPSERWDGLLNPGENQLEWFPPTIFDPPYTLKRRLR